MNIPNFNTPNFTPDLDGLERVRKEAIQKQEQQRLAMLQTADATTRTADSVEFLREKVDLLTFDLENERKERKHADTEQQIINDKQNKKTNRYAFGGFIIGLLGLILASFAIYISLTGFNIVNNHENSTQSPSQNETYNTGNNNDDNQSS